MAAPDSGLGQRIRLALLAAAACFALGFLALRLHDVQVRDHALYSGAQAQMTLRRVRLPATRGRILDRNGTVLADSRPRYVAALYLDELRAPGGWSNTVERVYAQAWNLARVVGRPPEVDRAAIWRHLRQRRPIPLAAYRSLSPEEIARLAEWPEALPGVDISVEQDRIYPEHDLACHIIGYAGRDVNPDRPAPPESADALGPDENGGEEFDYALPELLGREGIEKAFDGVLAGRGGAEALRIDVLGYKRETFPAVEPVHGGDVVLALDAGLQRSAENALGHWRGSAIVLDAQNGDVLALASAPRYDLSLFVPSLSSSAWSKLLADPDRPLLHRALSGLYAPGSVVKPAVALAALGAGVIEPASLVDCQRGFHHGGIDRNCSHGASHGPIDVVRALAVSCNAFFVSCGLDLGWEPGLRDAFASIGFGAAPKLGIPAKAGLLPDLAWKRTRNRRAAWTGGDTANVSIGQGDLLVTPMQIALYALALANDGDVLEPHLVLRAGDTPERTGREVVDHIAWHARDLELVRQGMLAAVNSPHGTARRIGLPALRLAAKTGTAEFESPDGFDRQHAWIIAYEPVEAPEHVYAVLAEDADGGGTTAAGILREILLHIHPELAEETEPVEE